MKARLFFSLLFWLSLFLSGCSNTYYEVNINSISSGEALNYSKCTILPYDPNLMVNQLQYKEYTGYIERILLQKGYEVIDNEGDVNECGVLILINYGITEPHESIYSYSTPIFGQTGVSSSYTTGTINNFGNTMSYSGSTTYTPQYGVIGSQSHIGTLITYSRFLILDAYDLRESRKTNKLVQLWSTFVVSTGSSGDLRAVFPVLLASSKQYIGSDTGKMVQVNISENDKRIKEVKGLLDNK